jgi:hypothetical protein
MYAEIVASNHAKGLDDCPRLCVMLSCVCKGLCDGLITDPQKSYQLSK